LNTQKIQNNSKLNKQLNRSTKYWTIRSRNWWKVQLGNLLRWKLQQLHCEMNSWPM